MSLETFAYGDHDLQTVTVARPARSRASSSYPADKGNDNDNDKEDEDGDGFWVILIHGGAWRDPAQTSTTYLVPALRVLSTSSPSPPKPESTSELENSIFNLPPSITGLASISYRLSPHPSYPENTTATVQHSTTVRDAKHPAHLIDIQSGLEFLQKKYGFRGRYVLVGHSCGATLGFQGVMSSLKPGLQAGLQAGFQRGEDPLAILGMAGIYDLRGLRDAHVDVPAYQEIMSGAFGEDERVWDVVSPGRVGGGDGVRGWDGRIIVLAHSKDDELCDFSQSERMKGFLELSGWERDGREVHLLSIEGRHDEAWEKGEELARGILFTIDRLQKMGL